MAKVRPRIIFLIFNSFLVAFVLAGNKMDKKGEDPKEALKNLGNFFKMMSGGNNGSCEFTCPDGLVPIPKRGHIPSSNGCGSMGIKLDTSLFPGFDVCCDTHDKCYDTCNSDRDKCDSKFNECLDNVCTKVKHAQSAHRVQICENAGGVMQAAATGLGCGAFKQAQEKACECSANAIEHDHKDEGEDKIIDEDNEDRHDNDDDDDDDDDDEDDEDDDDDNDKEAEKNEKMSGKRKENEDDIEKLEL